MQQEGGEDKKLDISGTTIDEKVISQLSDALKNTSVSLPNLQAGGSPAVSSNLPPPSGLPAQFNTPSLLASSTVAPSLLQNTQHSLASSAMPQMGGSYINPILSSSPAPLTMSGQSPLVGVSTPATIATPSPLHPQLSTPTRGVAPPPKAGFQPVPHSLHDFESHHASSTSSPSQGVVPPLSSPPAAAQTGVNIFTPAYDPNAAPSPYNSPPTMGVSMPYSAPSPQGSIHTGQGSASVELPLDISVQSPAQDSSNHSYQSQNSQDLNSLIEWIKTNETVHKVMQKAKSGVQTVITAMDPQMRDVLYSGGDINIMVASSKSVKVEPVKYAFQGVFGRATVNGMDSQPGIAPQPVGFSSGIKGAEERISNLRRSGQVTDRQVCVAIESFIVDLQPEQWYDISCLMLSDPVHNITIQTFSQATPVNNEYVQQAQSETVADYSLAWSGLSVTVGQIMHRQCAVNPSDWHYYFTGISRSETLLLAAKQLAYIYKQRLPRTN